MSPLMGADGQPTTGITADDGESVLPRRNSNNPAVALLPPRDEVDSDDDDDSHMDSGVGAIPAHIQDKVCMVWCGVVCVLRVLLVFLCIDHYGVFES